MGLKHEFVIVSKECKERIITSEMESIVIADEIIQYIFDNIKWIQINWNDEGMHSGISYYGFPLIQNNEIEKSQNIIERWIDLFKMAPTNFLLTDCFISDEDKYENIHFKREDILIQLELLKNICIKARKEYKNILHNGI